MIRVKAQAKINLTLDILGMRADGYHEVAMVMQSVSLADEVALSKTEAGIGLTIAGAGLAADESNLAWKAARLFLDVHNIHNGVDISLQKVIPMAAGLAGGSADAAAVLRGMNKLFATGDSLQELAELGARIGSDVPFCVRGGTMLATGRGEILQRLPQVPSFFVVLAKPPVDVSTAWAYKTYDALPHSYHPDNEAMLQALQTGDVQELSANLGNVLEGVTETEYPVISSYKALLKGNGALAAMMSGSGPTVFGLFATKAEAEKAGDIMKKKTEGAIFVAETANPEQAD